MNVHRLSIFLAGLAMTTSCAAAQERDACFAPGTALPEAATVLAAPGAGESTAALVEALLGRAPARATALLERDPELARKRLADGADMLSLAVASCDRALVDRMIAAGAPLDGQGAGLPLVLALRASDPWFAQRLLEAGAAPNPPDAPTVPMRTAIGLNAPAAVAMLLAAGADPEQAERTGTRPLHIALDMERFRIAELLLDRGGANPWAIDAGGANLATSAATPMLTDDPQEAAAQRRLAGRVRDLGWPSPAPDPREVRSLALDGRWPPSGSNAPPVPEPVLALIRERAQ